MIHDYILIGQGLAGSALAYQLIKRNKKILIIDRSNYPTSSKVAAGLANPFTGPRIVKSWKAEVLFPYLEKFYTELESETNSKFLTRRKIYRPFRSAEEVNDWAGRSTHPNYRQFVAEIIENGKHDDYVNNPFGGVEVPSFTLNVPIFIDKMHKLINAHSNIIKAEINEGELEVSPEGIKYKHHLAKRLVFCNGYEVQNSKYFGWVPIAPVKGEILHLKMKQDFETIYNRSCFIIPQGNGSYKAGSTYDRDDLSENTTEKGKNEICKKLDALLKMDYEVVRQEAGIRPGTVPRRPLIGRHPEFRNIFLFNGFGTKGVSLVPFFSEQFVKSLEEGNYLDEEVNIKKYYSLYFNSQFPEKN